MDRFYFNSVFESMILLSKIGTVILEKWMFLKILNYKNGFFESRNFVIVFM